MTKHICVVGGGVSGIVSAYLLSARHRVTLLEANDYVGGHTNTVTIERGPDAGMPVDTGFIVFNERTYPLFLQFMDELDVALAPTDMSFSYTNAAQNVCWAGTGVGGLFAQWQNAFSFRFWSMLRGIVGFCRQARNNLKSGHIGEVTLAEYATALRLPTATLSDYLYPMAAAIWSAPDAVMREYPARSFLAFFDNHGLLDLLNPVQWYYVRGGSQTYVRRALQELDRREAAVHASTPVRAVERGAMSSPAGVTVRTDADELTCDEVVLATHADQALALLTDADDAERAMLSPWAYSVNDTVLHTDEALLPPCRRAWASWNYMRVEQQPEATGAQDGSVFVNYHMNRLQQLDSERKRDHQYVVSLNAAAAGMAPHEGSVHYRTTYQHPRYDLPAWRSQEALAAHDGARHTHFAGAYHGNGFHEDGVRSAHAVASRFGLGFANASGQTEDV